VESGMPTICSESCVGRIRYNGLMLYDADRILELASTENEQDLYEAQCKIFLDPNDPKVIAAAREEGINEDWIIAAQKSPIYKMAIEWKIAFPLHPEFRTLPMIWYVPPLSPVQNAIDQGKLKTGPDGVIPLSSEMRVPVKYLANLMTAGKEAPIINALNRMIAMRSYQRMKRVEGVVNTKALEACGMTEQMAQDMYRYLGIANYEDRFVVPTSHEEERLDDAHGFQGQSGFSFGNTSSTGISKVTLFPRKRTESMEPREKAPYVGDGAITSDR
jgi:nitrate reductase beta subunit